MDDEPYIFDEDDPDLDELVTVASLEFCAFFGGCVKCPGWGTIGQLRSRNNNDNFESELPANQIVFCTHWCHLEASET